MQAACPAVQCSIPAATSLLPPVQYDKKKRPYCISRLCDHTTSTTVHQSVKAGGAAAASRPGCYRWMPQCLPVLCTAVPSQQEDLPLESPGPNFRLGFACLPGVVSPQHFQAYWSVVCRPRLEALYRTAAGMSAHPALLPVMDQLIAELKQVSVPATHCAQRHEDAAWCSAAADVAESCSKFEQYLYRSKGLYIKICEVQRRLQAAQYEASMQQQVTPGKVHLRSVWVRTLQDELGRRASPHQLLRLATLLRYTFERQGVAVEDGLSHLIASHSPGTLDAAWADATQLLQKERRVAARVRAVIADASLAPVLELADVHWPHSRSKSASGDADTHADNELLHISANTMEARQPPWSGDALLTRLILRTPQLSGRPELPVTITLGMSAVPGPQPEPVSRLSPGWSSADEDDGSPGRNTDLVAGANEGSIATAVRPVDLSDHAQPAGGVGYAADGAELQGAAAAHTQLEPASNGLQAAVRSQAQELSPGITETPALWSDAVLLDRSATQELLRLHPVPSLRSAVLEEGCIRRMLVMLQLISQQAALRAQIARLYDQPSFAHVMQPEGLCAHGGPDNILRTLKHIAKAIQPAAHAQVLQLEQQLSHIHQPACGSWQTGVGNIENHQQQQQQQHGSSTEAADVACLQQQLQQKLGLDLTYEEIESYLYLSNLVQGLSDVLTHSMGLSLQVAHQPSSWHQLFGSALPATPNNGHRPCPCTYTAGQVDKAQLWCAEHQLVLHVFDTHRQPCTGDALEMQDAVVSTTSVPGSHSGLGSAAASSLVGIIYLDLGAGYGTRQLRFTHMWGKSLQQQQQALNNVQAQQLLQQDQWPANMDHSNLSFVQEQAAVVSIGLQRSWQNGAAGSFSAVWELFHELGHALHLLLSSRGQLFKHWGGLHLPLDILEVPSMWLERMLTHPASIHIICRQHNGQQLPAGKADMLAQQFKATHCNALDFQEQVLVALADQLLAQAGAEEAPDALACYSMVQERFSALPHVPVTLKRLSTLPVAAHHQAMFWTYVTSALAAAQLWDNIRSTEPLGSAQGRIIRRVLLEASAETPPRDVLASIHNAVVALCQSDEEHQDASAAVNATGQDELRSQASQMTGSGSTVSGSQPVPAMRDSWWWTGDGSSR